MSELLKLVEAKATGRSYHDDLKPSDIVSMIDSYQEIMTEQLIEYRIDVRIGQTILARNIEDLTEAKKLVTHKIARFVYGEVINDLLDIRLALYDRDREKAQRLVTKALDKLKP
jgi:hypothetical protein